MINKGKLLGIDYGDALIGIAITDPDQLIAFPRMSIENKGKQFVLNEIIKFCETENIKGIILGLPLNLDGTKSKQTIKTEKFGDLLIQNLNIPLKYHDERLTSKESDVIISSIKKRHDEKKHDQNAIAASLILKNYLDLLGNMRERGEARDA